MKKLCVSFITRTFITETTTQLSGQSPFYLFKWIKLNVINILVDIIVYITIPYISKEFSSLK